MPVVISHFAYRERLVRRKGREDGRVWRWRFWPFAKTAKCTVPTADHQGDAPYESELCRSAETAMTVLASEWQEEDVALTEAYVRAAAEQLQAREQLRKESAESATATLAFDQIRANFLALEQPAMGKTLALILLLVFGAAEAVFNGIVFQVFGERQIFTWLVALGLGVLLPYLGHTAGHFLKQRTKRPMDWVVLSATTLISVLALIGVANLRGTFLETSHVRELLGYSMTVAAARGIFFLINLVLFIGAIVIGYQSSHVNAPAYKTVCKQYRHAMQRKEKEGGEAAAATARLEAADRALTTTRHRRKRRFETCRGEAEFIRAKNEWLASVYREANLAARENAGVPPCFKQASPVAAVPAVFKRDLDWPGEAELGVRSATTASEDPGRVDT